MNIPDPVMCPASMASTTDPNSDEWRRAVKNAVTTELQSCYGRAINFDHLVQAHDLFEEMGHNCKFWADVYLTCARMVGKHQGLHSALLALTEEMDAAKRKGQAEEPAPVAPA